MPSRKDTHPRRSQHAVHGRRWPMHRRPMLRRQLIYVWPPSSHRLHGVFFSRALKPFWGQRRVLNLFFPSFFLSILPEAMCSSFTSCSASNKVLIANAQSTACLQAACTEGECCTLRMHNGRVFTYELMCGCVCFCPPFGAVLFCPLSRSSRWKRMQLLSLEGALWRFHTSEQTFK